MPVFWGFSKGEKAIRTFGTIPIHAQLFPSIRSHSPLFAVIPSHSPLFAVIPSHSQSFPAIPICLRLIEYIQYLSVIGSKIKDHRLKVKGQKLKVKGQPQEEKKLLRHE
jgi:hypothetical protein